MHLLVSGRVQGVGFRFFVVRAARDAGLLGWVRNLADGRVEVWAEGAPAALETLERFVRRGPPRAHVTGVTRTEEQARGEFDSFEHRI